MNVEPAQIRSYRLRAHHLDKRLPASGLEAAAGACGVQNSPPGAWETAMLNRLEGCTLQLLQDALYREKRLLQAWSFRGAPVVFPTAESGVFLTPLKARGGEEPWIYTRGVAAALEYLQLPFGTLLQGAMEAAARLEGRTVQSKEALDRALSEIMEEGLPADRRALWRAPSMYGSPERQTVGDAVASFLLRPCAFSSLVVFGERQDGSPSFTSFRSWTGRTPDEAPGGDRALVRKFLHCYGPATERSLMEWLGCSRPQAHRLWSAAAEELEPVSAGGKTRYLLAADREALRTAGREGDRLTLLGAHDPYLDVRDRAVLLEEPALQRAVWRTVANPGAILRGGRIVGVWQTRTRGARLEAAMTLFERLSPPERKRLEDLAEEYAAFRRLALRDCRLDGGA